MTPPDQATITGAPQATLVAAGALIEAPVHGRDGEKLGKVAEIMLAAGKGEIVYVVLARGGVIGLGETLHAVSWCNFIVDPIDGHLSLPLCGSDLDASGGFDKDSWPVDATV